MNMKIFTARRGEVSLGAKIEKYVLKGAGIEIPALLIGEEGRGRKLGALPAKLLPEQYREWKEKGSVRIYTATIGETKSGKPKLFQTKAETRTDTTEAIVVLRTPIGFRGSNDHTGDRSGNKWCILSHHINNAKSLGIPIQDRYTREEAEEYARKIAREFFPGEYDRETARAFFEQYLYFHPFPGRCLTSGTIAQGDAGRMGSGQQTVAVIPAGVVFRTGYYGRRYGSPPSHYYVYRDGELLSATWEEREMTDIF
jgi:hypothetical protein